MFYRLSKEELNDLRTIKAYADLTNIQIQPGWFNTIKQLGLDIEKVVNEENIQFPQINQIKSKFGTLRFYYMDESKNEKLKDLIIKYHTILDNTCEICGSTHNTETMIKDKFVITLCEEHNSPEYVSFASMSM